MAGTGQELANRDERSPAHTGSEGDPAEEPSAAWGWHGEFRRGRLIAGWVTTAIMLVMLVGNHQGRVEDVWLVVIAAVMAFGLTRQTLRERRSRQR